MAKTEPKTKEKSKLIERPHLTERSAAKSADVEHPVYTFVVAKSATKPMIKREIKALYQVTPRKVAILNVRARQVFVRGRLGHQPGFKKALVYLKKGDKIEFV